MKAARAASQLNGDLVPVHGWQRFAARPCICKVDCGKAAGRPPEETCDSRVVTSMVRKQGMCTASEPRRRFFNEAQAGSNVGHGRVGRRGRCGVVPQVGSQGQAAPPAAVTPKMQAPPEARALSKAFSGVARALRPSVVRLDVEVGRTRALRQTASAAAIRAAVAVSPTCASSSSGSSTSTACPQPGPGRGTGSGFLHRHRRATSSPTATWWTTPRR